MRNKIFFFFLHYGISFVLVVMFVSIVYVTQVIEINNKTQVDMIYEHDGNCYCYLPKTERYSVKDNILYVCSGENGMEQLRILDITECGQYIVCWIEFPSGASRSDLIKNRKVTIYIKKEKIKIYDLIFGKWFEKF